VLRRRVTGTELLRGRTSSCPQAYRVRGREAAPVHRVNMTDTWA
jgi:hypothetical protein